MCELCKKKKVNEWNIKQNDKNKKIFADLERREILFTQVMNLKKKLDAFEKEADFLKTKIYLHLEEHHNIKTTDETGLDYRFKGGDLIVSEYKNTDPLKELKGILDALGGKND